MNKNDLRFEKRTFDSKEYSVVFIAGTSASKTWRFVETKDCEDICLNVPQELLDLPTGLQKPAIAGVVIRLQALIKPRKKSESSNGKKRNKFFAE